MSLSPNAIRELIRAVVLAPGFRRGSFAGAIRGTTGSPWIRVGLRTISLRGQDHVQFAYSDGKKEVARNFARGAAEASLNELIGIGFSGIHLESAEEAIDIRTSKKGKVYVGRKPLRNAPAAEAHDRVKDLPLPEGRTSWLLEALGIATADGRVRPTMRAKFTQINEFLKHLTHVLADAGLRDLGRPLEILDCGCGSSYLTLAAHHYLNDVLGTPARLIGVDVNEELIRKSMIRAEKVGAAEVNFACDPIAAVAAKPDIVFALHACDTATDD